MRVGKIAHATITVQTGALRCVMDPIFERSFASDLYCMSPAVELDVEALCAETNLVVISHNHVDHFSPRSLVHFGREVPVLYPEGDEIIRTSLATLGFRHAVAYRTGQRIDFGGATLIPTASAVPFPENGMLFCADGKTFWNAVDTALTEATIGYVREVVGRPDLMFASYQPLVSEELLVNGLGADFPHAAYSKALRWVLDAAPKWVTPGSCGFWFNTEWFNDRCFPVSEQQFEEDLARTGADIRVAHVPHGGAIELDTMNVEPEGQQHVRRVDRAQLHLPAQWRPDKGVPALVDDKPQQRSAVAMRRAVRSFLDHQFLPRLATTDQLWLELMRRLRAVWELVVVFPGGSEERRRLDFSEIPLAWKSSEEGFVAMRTRVTASGLVGALDGVMNGYALRVQARRMNRLYAVNESGVQPEGGEVADPLFRVIMPDLENRFFEHEVQQALAES